MNLVEITWRDASNAAGWHSVDSLDEQTKNSFLLCRTYGVLMHTNDEAVVAVQTVGSNMEHDVGGLWTIPRSMVLKIRIIEKVEFDG